MRKISLITISIFLTVLLLFSSAAFAFTSPKTTINLNETKTALVAGYNLQLTASVTPASASKKLSWSTSNKKIITVDNNGKVTAVGPGKAYITVKTADAKVSAKCEFTVTKLDENYTLKITVSLSGSTSSQVKNYLKWLKDKGIKAEMLVIPANGSQYDQKVAISLMAGEDIDLINCNNSTGVRLANSNTLTPLDSLAKNVNYDMYKMFGDNVYARNGKAYALPMYIDSWVCYYNKKIFDDAKVPYPSAEGWTWDKYIETAKKLTDPSKGIFGSFMVYDWGQMNYIYAKQKKTKEYKEDGTSNFDDPAWAESMKWFGDLGNVLKIQPDILTYKSKKMNYDAFFTGNYGMWCCGSWSLTSLSDFSKYPRTWKVGILPFPYPKGYNKTDLCLNALRAIPASSKHKQEAFRALTVLAEDWYKIAPGVVPSRRDMTEDQVQEYIDRAIVRNYYQFDGITGEEFDKAFFDPKTEYVIEKMTGPANTVIDAAFTSEGELYQLGQKSLEDAMMTIKSRADKAIVEEKAAQK